VCTDHDAVLSRPWALAPQVALRPERFGALAYDFGTRRLSFLKSPRLLATVRALETYPTALEACIACGVDDAELGAYAGALARLADTGMICERTG
jgi:putative mycofactocin binding protein MftB